MEEPETWIIVCGSRTWTNREKLEAVLERYYEREGRALGIRHGGASGADRIARSWCVARGVRFREYLPRYQGGFQDRAAPILRNQEMADDGAMLCIAFWNGVSRGTLDMIRRCAKAGIEIRIIPEK